MGGGPAMADLLHVMPVEIHPTRQGTPLRGTKFLPFLAAWHHGHGVTRDIDQWSHG